MIRTFAWSAVGSALSIALYAVFLAKVGVGAASDSFFAVLAVCQTMSSVLYAPYEGFAQRFALEELRGGRSPVGPLVASYLALSGATLIPYYLWGERVLGPLFGRAYSADPALWRYHFHVLATLVPLTGLLATLQVCCQARERYVFPKVGLALGRFVALAVLIASGSGALRTISVAVVVAHVVAVAASASHAGSWGLAQRSLWPDLRTVLREWFRINRWTVVLRTDALVERVLAAHVKSGFLSVFSLGWSVVMSVVEAFHSSFVVADSNRYFAGAAISPAVGPRALLAGEYRRSTAAARWLTAAAGAAAVAVALVAWSADRMLGSGKGVGRPDLALLLGTLVIALFIFFLWKQFAGAFAIQGRAVEFARTLTLVYLVWVGPRVALTWYWGAVGFCLGIVAYYGSQVAVLGRVLAVARRTPV